MYLPNMTTPPYYIAARLQEKFDTEVTQDVGFVYGLKTEGEHTCRSFEQFVRFNLI